MTRVATVCNPFRKVLSICYVMYKVQHGISSFTCVYCI